MKRYRIIRRFISEKRFYRLIPIIILMLIMINIYLLSGCVGYEKTYTHSAPQNYTEKLILFPDGTFTGVFYEDRYFPQISISGVYKITNTEIILTTPTGNTIMFTKSGKNLIFEGDTWE